MDSDSDEYGTIKHSVRIRFTISSTGVSSNPNSITQKSSADLSDSDRSSVSNCQNVEHRNHLTFTRQDETSPKNSEIGNSRVGPKKIVRSFKYVEPQNHKSALFVNLSCNNADNSDSHRNQRSEKQLFISPELNHPTSSTGTSPTSPPTPESVLDSSSYELIDWDEEKRAIERDEEKHRERTYSFLDSTSVELEPEAVANRNTMSHGCNFINWMSATRRRASSATPAAQTTIATERNKNDESSEGAPSASTTISSSGADRRASSSDELARLALPESNLLASNRSTSANHLGIGASVETVCGSDDTQTNACVKSSAARNTSVEPLEIEIDSPQMDQLVSPFSVSSHPVSLDDILKIDMDNMRLEEECRTWEAQAQYWEQKVEELERQQFASDVPRTLVDSIIKHRKELRDLEYEIYKRTLDSEESDALSCEGKLSQNMNWLDDTSPSDLQSPAGNKFMDAQMYYMNDVDNQLVGDMDESLSLSDTRPPIGKYGPHLRPGQENTADILEAVPPPSSLQRRHYLNKASSGTDTSEYSQLPSFNQHGHKIIHHQISYQPMHDEQERFVLPGQVHQRPRHHHQAHNHQHHHQQHHNHHQSSSSSQQRVSRRHVQHQHRHQHQQLYAQVEAGSDIGTAGKYSSISPINHHRHRASPIRPDHFKGEFRSPQVAAGAQDSSSTASSSSPQ